MKNKISAGMIGLGEWGKYIVKTLNNNFPNVSLDCISYRKSKYRDLLPKNCKIYLNWKKMILNEKVDCIFVAVLPRLNLQIFKAIKQKKSTFIFRETISSKFIGCKKNIRFIKKLFSSCSGKSYRFI